MQNISVENSRRREGQLQRIVQITKHHDMVHIPFLQNLEPADEPQVSMVLWTLNSHVVRVGSVGIVGRAGTADKIGRVGRIGLFEIANS